MHRPDTYDAQRTGDARPRDRVAVLLWTAAIAWIAVSYAACASLPLLADDHVHLAAAQRWTSLRDLLATPPPRPLQHAVFALGSACGDHAPHAMRAVATALYLAAIVMVGVVARGFGLSPRRSALAAAVAAAFPAVRTVEWPAAVSGPGRLAATLVVLWAFQRGAQGWHAVAALAAAAVALAFHQCAVMLPALVALQRWACAGARASDVRPAASALARVPAFWMLLAVVAAAAAWFTSVPDPHLVARPWGARAANVAWFATGLWPEAARLEVLDALRGSDGTAGALAAGALLLAFAFAALVWFARGGPVARFAALAAAGDVLLPVSTAGFSLRYVLPAAAFVAIALAAAATTAPRLAAVAAVGLAWLHDGVRGVAEFRAAAALSGRLVARAAAVRAAVPAQRMLFVVDAPFAHGPARDVPLANFGFAEAVAAAGAPGPITQLYSARQPAGTAARVVTPAAVAALRAREAVLEFDAARGDFVFHDRGRRQEPR